MSLSDVQHALLQEVETTLAGWPISGENLPLTDEVVPADGKWASVFFVPNTPEVSSLGAAGEDMVTGFLQVNLFYPQGVGAEDARADFETLRAAFPAGGRPAYNGQEVIITSSGRAMGTLSDGWYKVPVTVTWYALIPR